MGSVCRPCEYAFETGWNPDSSIHIYFQPLSGADEPHTLMAIKKGLPRPVNARDLEMIPPLFRAQGVLLPWLTVPVLPRPAPRLLGALVRPVLLPSPTPRRLLSI